MNNSLFCHHNILLIDRCPRCVVERRVSYSNRLDNLMNLTSYENRLLNYENRLLNYENRLVSYRSNLLTYIELQVRDKIVSDLNYLLSIVNSNSFEREALNIRRFYSNLLSEINLFDPNTFHIRDQNLRYSENLRYAENLLQENRNRLRARREHIYNLINPNPRESLITQRTDNVGTNPIVTRNNNPTRTQENILKLSIKDLNKNTTLEIFTCNEDDEPQNCTICISPLENNTIIRKLSCNHKFHYNCVDKWFEEKHKCPICRHNLLTYFMV